MTEEIKLLCGVCRITTADTDLAVSRFYSRHHNTRQTPACQWAKATNRLYNQKRREETEERSRAALMERELARSAQFALPPAPFDTVTSEILEADCWDCDWYTMGDMAAGQLHALETGHEVDVLKSRIYTMTRRGG